MRSTAKWFKNEKKNPTKKPNPEVLSDDAYSQLPKKQEMPTVTHYTGLKWCLFKKNLTHNTEDCLVLRSKCSWSNILEVFCLQAAFQADRFGVWPHFCEACFPCVELEWHLLQFVVTLLGPLSHWASLWRVVCCFLCSSSQGPGASS